MSKNLLIALAVGFLAVGGIVFFSYQGTEDLRLTLETSLRKVRVVETSPESSVAFFDFSIQNRTNVPFVMKEAKIYLIRADGFEIEGETQPRSTVDRMLNFLPQAGGKVNEVLIPSDKIAKGPILDRMLGASFTLPVSTLEQRKHFRIELIDLDGAKFVLTEVKK